MLRRRGREHLGEVETDERQGEHARRGLADHRFAAALDSAYEHAAGLRQPERVRSGVEGEDAGSKPGLEDIEPTDVVERHVGLEELEARGSTEGSSLLCDEPLERLLWIAQRAPETKGAPGFVEGEPERGADELFARPARAGSGEHAVERGAHVARARQGESEDGGVAVEVRGEPRGGHREHEGGLARNGREVAQGSDDASVLEPRVEIEHHAGHPGFSGPSCARDARERIARLRVVVPAAGHRPSENTRVGECGTDERSEAPFLVRHHADDRRPRRPRGAKIPHE